MVCLPSIATAACFVAILLLDLYNRDWRRIPGHALLGIFAVFLTLFICERSSDFVAWILLGSPFILVFAGYFVSSWLEARPKYNPPEPEPSPIGPSGCGCGCCRMSPCRCNRPCWRPRRRCPQPKPEPKPKPDNCIQSSLAE